MTLLRIGALLFVLLLAPLQVLYINQTIARLPFDATSLACVILIIILIIAPLRHLSFKSCIGIGLIAFVSILGICGLHRLSVVVTVAIPLLNILALASYSWPRVAHYMILAALACSITIAAYGLGTVPSLAIQLMAGDFYNNHLFIRQLFSGYLVDLSVAAVAVLPSIGLSLTMWRGQQIDKCSGSDSA